MHGRAGGGSRKINLAQDWLFTGEIHFAGHGSAIRIIGHQAGLFRCLGLFTCSSANRPHPPITSSAVRQHAIKLFLTINSFVDFPRRLTKFSAYTDQQIAPSYPSKSDRFFGLHSLISKIWRVAPRTSPAILCGSETLSPTGNGPVASDVAHYEATGCGPD